MRASEMINARCGWIEYSRFGDEETVVIDIVGKGDKQRRPAAVFGAGRQDFSLSRRQKAPSAF